MQLSVLATASQIFLPRLFKTASRSLGEALDYQILNQRFNWL